MKKIIYSLLGLVCIIVVIVIFINNKKYNEERPILTSLYAVTLQLKLYEDDNGKSLPEAYPKSLSYMTAIDVPQKIIDKIVYTYPQKELYTVKICSTFKNKLWFYYPYKKEAWICLDGIVRANKIPLSDILYKGKPITEQPSTIDGTRARTLSLNR